MSENPTVDQALGWLTEQLGGLSRVRNASPRSAEFRQWRQATLTAIQRIWPRDRARSDRFRHVPFYPNAERAPESAVREAFDKGCSEARRLLRMWIAELRHDGLAAPAPEAVEAPQPKDPHDHSIKLTPLSERPQAPAPIPEDGPDVRSLDKPVAEPRARGGKGGKRLKDMLGLGASIDEPTGGARASEREAQEPRSAGKARNASERASKQKAVPRATPERVAPARRAETPPTAAPVRPTDDLASSITQALERAKQESGPSTRREPSTRPEPSAPPDTSTRLEPSRRPESSQPPEPSAGPEPPPRSARREFSMPTVPAVPAAPAPVSPRDPAAKEMYVIIAQLDALGVPAPECERVRMVLALMAQSIESGTVEWDSLRATLTAALEFPALAHRVMAVLRPFFEAAA